MMNRKGDYKQQMVWTTPKGDVLIRSFCTSDEIRQYTLDGQFGHYAHYKSLYTQRESLEKDADQTDANVTLALSERSNIIGYGVLVYPATKKKWAVVGKDVVMELKALEVSRAWRSFHIVEGILRLCLAHPEIEEKILFLVGYSWTWDLEWTKHSTSHYKDMLVRLFEPHGFKEMHTNDPNVNLKPENIMMARIGKNVEEAVRERFKWARYGI
jgi:acetoin utilization protein AcuA